MQQNNKSQNLELYSVAQLIKLLNAFNDYVRDHHADKPYSFIEFMDDPKTQDIIKEVLEEK